MRVDTQSQDAQPVVEVVIPHRPVPRRGWALEHLGAPDVVDQDVDDPVVGADPVGEGTHLCDIEMVDLDRDADSAEFGDQFGGLLDGLRSVVIRLRHCR